MLHGYGPKKVPGGVGFVVGNEDLQIPPLILANGPQGWGAWAGDVGNATAFPSSLTVAATWDTELAARWGVAMGTEFWEKGTNVQLVSGSTQLEPCADMHTHRIHAHRIHAHAHTHIL